MVFLYIFVFFVLIILAIRMLWMSTIWGKVSANIQQQKYPGPPALPVLGNVLQFKTDPAELTKQVFDWYKVYGSPTRLMFGPFSIVHISRANQVEAVLKSSVNITKSRNYEMISDWLGYGLLTSTGKRWFRKRKLLTPAFHFQILKDFMPIYNEQAEKLVHILKSKAEKNQPFNISKLLSLCTLDVICETAMGKRLNAMDNANSPYVNAIMDFAEVLLERGMRPWLWPGFIFYNFSAAGRRARKQLKILHDFTWKVITEREASRVLNGDVVSEETSGKRRRLAFLDLLLEMKRKGEMDMEEIREEVDTFMFEGHDTTATGLMWAVYCIGHNPECQKQIHEELESVFGDDLSVCPTAEQLHELKYLECCIKESQRVYPSVPFIERRVVEPMKIDETYTLPVGVVIGINIVALHRDPSYFPDPMKYDPTRFFPENSADRHPFAFTPFSAGPRNCIGQKFAFMEEKVILCHVLRNFWIESVDPEESIDPAVLLVFRPTKGIFVKLTPRY